MCLCVQSITADLRDLLTVHKPASAVYSTLTLAYLAAGAAYLTLPAETLVHVFSMPACPMVTMADWVFLWRCLGASLLCLPTWTYSLKVLRVSCTESSAL